MFLVNDSLKSNYKTDHQCQQSSLVSIICYLENDHKDASTYVNQLFVEVKYLHQYSSIRL